jgi:SAM-dependent methyltransferase
MRMTRYLVDSGSFRDRRNRIFYHDGAVLRGLDPHSLREWMVLSSTEFFSRFQNEGKIVKTERFEKASASSSADIGEWAEVLKHERVPFVSYPYEWCFSMLRDAALLQLELLLAALREDMILKDASAFNFQWVGAHPLFIDIPSFEQFTEGDPWVGYRQFCQMFLYPLFLQAYKNVSFQQWLRGSIDGIEPDQCNNLMSVRDLLRPGVFTHVYLQAKMQARYGSSPHNVKKSLRTAGFSKNMIEANVKRLHTLVSRLTWQRSSSEWSDYEKKHSYSDHDSENKKAFLRDIVSSQNWNLVWDLGCNTGAYSLIAAKGAGYVVAMDADSLAVERFYRKLKAENNTSILPLVMNIADPSPNLGWNSMERKALAVRGKPDLTLCLALIHHLSISAHIPVQDVIDWLASLNTSLVIEFITKDDPMVKTLLRNKEDIYQDYNIDFFEQHLSRSFHVLRREILASGTRFLYFARAKNRPR